MTWVLRFTTVGAPVGGYQFNANDLGTCRHLRFAFCQRDRIFLRSFWQLRALLEALRVGFGDNHHRRPFQVYVHGLYMMKR
jgi:hypothetical protein